jgi:hypothetical protein
MMTKTERKVGDVYRPYVNILKVKNGLPTVIRVDGQTYLLKHETQYNRGTKK